MIQMIREQAHNALLRKMDGGGDVLVGDFDIGDLWSDGEGDGVGPRPTHDGLGATIVGRSSGHRKTPSIAIVLYDCHVSTNIGVSHHTSSYRQFRVSHNQLTLQSGGELRRSSLRYAYGNRNEHPFVFSYRPIDRI